MTESKFNTRNISIILFCLLLAGCLLYILLSGDTGLPPAFSIPFSALILLLMLWLIFVELRKKAVKVRLQNDTILVSRFLGFGHPQALDYTSIDGYKIVVLPSEDYELEYLHLIKEGKKVITLSEFYHSNYAELKEAMSGKTRNLGQEQFRLFG